MAKADGDGARGRAAGEKMACINVDLDAIPHYLAIHGLSGIQVSPEVRCAVCRTALPRFLELFGSLGLRATFFTVGADLDDEGSAAQVRAASEAGHEIASHTQTHPYALTRLDGEALAREVSGAEAAILRVTGRRPVGFRAPGYAVTAPLLRLLDRRGYAYDSSAFPAAPYYAAKAGIMGALRLAGRPSAAILDRPRVLAAPLAPYHPYLCEPYRPARGAFALRLAELPLSVGPVTRIPFIGTSALLFPERAVRAFCRRMVRLPWVNLELHGIDLLDSEDLGLPQLSAVQRELGIPLKDKLRRLRELFAAIREASEVVTLEEVAGRID